MQHDIEDLSHYIKSSIFGKIAILWATRHNKPEIVRIILSSPELPADKVIKTDFNDSSLSASPSMIAYIDQMISHISGKGKRQEINMLDWSSRTDFQSKVMHAVYNIPRGKVSTYGTISEKAGCSGGARAVGMVMAGNPFPLAIPCHRVVRADGSLGGFGYGLKMKRDLLKAEGVKFTGSKVSADCIM